MCIVLSDRASKEWIGLLPFLLLTLFIAVIIQKFLKCILEQTCDVICIDDGHCDETEFQMR